VSCAVAGSRAALSHRRSAAAIASDALRMPGYPWAWRLSCARGRSGNYRRSFSLSECADAAR
jgi:hypothetical protein